MTAALITPPIEASASASGQRNGARDEAVSIQNVHKSYDRGGDRTPVLTGCSLSVRRGECVFLVGPSGSGKTTLLSIIGCVLRADAGSVRVMGHNVDALSKAAAAEVRRTQIGFVFQKYHLVHGLSALENVCLPLILDGVSRSVAERRGRDLLGRVGLADKLRTDPRRLSVGQCQRVAVARALVADPPLILADEPTASLDAALGQQAMRLLRELTTEQGKTAIVVTHDPRIEAFADRTLVMEGGRLSASVPRSAVATSSAAGKSTPDMSHFSPARPG
jgi:putative ABC transport system ATP-binding protein